MRKIMRLMRLAGLLGVGVWALQFGSVGAQQGPPGGLFAEASGTAAADTPLEGGELRSRLVTFDRDRILIPRSPGVAAASTTGGAPRLVLNLFDDTTVVAVFERLEVDRDSFPTWIGAVEGRPASTVTLTVGDGVLAGIVQTREATYALRPAGPGVTRVVEIDRRNLKPDGEPIRVPLPPEVPSAQTAQDDAGTIDVLIFYTPLARRLRGGAAGITTWAVNQIANANTAYADSGVNQRLRLVGLRDVAQTGSDNPETDLNRLTAVGDGYYDEVHAIRDAVRADLVHLAVGNLDNACGIANLMEAGQNSTAFSPSGFSVSTVGCDVQYSFAHELGHNMGANHAPTDPVSPRPLYAYAFGLKDLAGGWRSLMAYACNDPAGATCPRVPRISNASMMYNGRPQGSITQNNAAVFNNTAASVANFRQNSPGRLPGIPGQPAVTVDQVAGTFTISWTAPTFGDAATSYVIQAGYGAELNDIPEVPLGNVLTLTATAPRGRYFIRIRAVNAQGRGAPSDDREFTVGDTSPPNPPTNFTAAVSGNSVTFNWVAPAGGAATGYVVQAGGSAGATTMSLPTSATTLTGTGPDGTYFARVRATNTAGQSAPSNEVSFRLGATAIAPPGVPTSLVASLRQSRIDLAWVAPTTGGAVADYILEAGSSSGSSNIFNGSVGNVLGYGATAPNGRYYARVRARNAAGTSGPSNEVVIVPDSTACTGDISATLAWNTATDLDLHVIEPNGTHVYYGHRTGTTAVLDRDNTSGFGPENICVAAGRALPGFYEVFVVYYSGSPSTTATITVRTKAGTPSERFQSFTRTLTSANRQLGIKVSAVDGVGNQIVDLNGTRVPPSDSARDLEDKPGP